VEAPITPILYDATLRRPEARVAPQLYLRAFQPRRMFAVPCSGAAGTTTTVFAQEVCYMRVPRQRHGAYSRRNNLRPPTTFSLLPPCHHSSFVAHCTAVHANSLLRRASSPDAAHAVSPE